MKKIVSFVMFLILLSSTCNYSFAENEIKSVKIVRMEVPCCSGLENAARRAIKASGKFLPWQVVTITTDGKILD